jgi:anti-sigma factor RsiW
MTDSKTSSPDLHPAALLMPWYASGTLSERERLEVENHLRTCAACCAELESVGVFRQHARTLFEDQPIPERRMFEAVMSRVEADTAARMQEVASARVQEDAATRVAQDSAARTRSAGSRSSEPGVLDALMQPLRALMRPAWVPALAVLLIIVQAGALTWLAYERSHTPSPVTARGIEPSAARIRIVFNPRATERDIRTALQTLGGRIVDGPAADGAYVIQLPAVAPTVLSQRLRALREQPGLVERIENATP